MEQIKGEENLFYIKKNNAWVPVACLTASPISEESETIKTTTRDNEGWNTDYPTNQSYSIQLSGIMIKDDLDSGNNIISYRELRSYKRNKILIDWMRKTLSGWYVDSGKGHVTSISDSDTAGDFISFNATIIGYGKPDEANERIRVLGEGPNTIMGDKDYEIIKTD
ncbi:Phage tail tube protein [Chryseobacterium oranimense]|uniref:Phage tail tube protein n=1 Tax=Chryseobacterium oranimense TaxID=421058 RepID=A0A1M5V067_9FLAO|nr:phage tail tube protein [Chryseobacterium oranimense]SHH68697.1 Phage tail tube protein [Chryseobacterium oranimense]